MKVYPTSTANPNVPQNVLIVCEYQTMSGEITHTYFLDEKGNPWYAVDWINRKPQNTTLRIMADHIGSHPDTIVTAWKHWKESNK